MRISWKTLLIENVANQAYANGYQDGSANSRTEGRQQGMTIAKRQIAKALLRENLTPTLIAKVTGLPLAAIELLLPDTASSKTEDNVVPSDSQNG